MALTLSMCAGSAAAGDDRTVGLLWNRTGLPAVFPLIIFSAQGQDYVVVLSDARDCNKAMAAVMRGGEPMRMLVPPGSFNIGFWAAESIMDDGAFAGAPIFSVAEPLTFAVTGLRGKTGHRIDISNANDSRGPVTTQTINRVAKRTAALSATPSLPAVHIHVQEPVGLQFLKRRFERGMPVTRLYDRLRQQQDYDPPVLGLPQVPLAWPQCLLTAANPLTAVPCCLGK